MWHRPIQTLHTASDFKKAYRKLPRRIQDAADERTDWFRANAVDPRLNTHKLKGALRDHWSFSVTHSHRILFRFEDDTTVTFVDIGTHAIYQ